jgi:hypothetical protein
LGRDLNFKAATPIRRLNSKVTMAKVAATTTNRKAPTVMAKRVKTAPIRAARTDKVCPRPETADPPNSIRAKSPKGSLLPR